MNADTTNHAEICCPAGGIMAYVKKASTKSLTAAGGSALIVSLAARNMVGVTT